MNSGMAGRVLGFDHWGYWQGPDRVKSVVLCNRRLPVNFRYALLATEIARRCNMSRRAKMRRGARSFDHLVGGSKQHRRHVKAERLGGL